MNNICTPEGSLTLPLSKLKAGESARVVRFDNVPSSYQRKLMSLGLIVGTNFTVKRTAPLGDPVELNIRGFRLSLRRAEASGIIVEKTPS